jgi:hypothetical protein
MTSTNKAARLAGLLYLLCSVPGIFALLYVSSRLVVSGNPAATARNIVASEALFRAGIAADLIGVAGFIFVAAALYRLLEGVNRRMAALMVMLIVLSAPIAFVSEVFHLVALRLLDPAGPAAALGEEQRNTVLWLLLGAFDNANLVAEIFWGLWLFPLGLLVIQSHFLPRILGVLLFLAGVAWIAESLTRMVAPDHAHAVEMVTSWLRAFELALPLWLLIMGAKDRPLAA